jgi:hypothetical protein
VIVATTSAGGARGGVDVAPGETKAIALAFVPRAAPPPPPTVIAPAPRSALPRVMEIGGIGLAGAGVLVGSIAGGLSLSSTSAAKRGCTDDRCPPSTWSDIDSAHTTATVATVGFAAAGVGAVVAVVGFFLDRDPPRAAPATGAGWTPWFGAGSAGVRGTF